MNYPSIRIEGERRRLVSMATYRDTAGACRVLAVLPGHLLKLNPAR